MRRTCRVARTVIKACARNSLAAVRNTARRLSKIIEALRQRLRNRRTKLDENDLAAFQTITIPMVRRFYPSLIAHQLVGVQPLVGPSAHVYYNRFRGFRDYNGKKRRLNRLRTRKRRCAQAAWIACALAWACILASPGAAVVLAIVFHAAAILYLASSLCITLKMRRLVADIVADELMRSS